MKERSLGIILGILNIVLLVVCGFFFWGKDKTAPEIFLPEASVVYAEENGEEELFAGVIAFDAEDGELTESIVIEKIVTDKEKATATITYGVADSSGNVGKATQTVEMVVTESNDEEDTMEEVAREAEEDIEGSENEDDSSEDTEEDAETSEENEEEDAETSEENHEEQDDTEDDSVSEGLPTAGEARNAGRNVSSRQNSERPVIVLKTQEVTTKVGKGPAWVNVIGELSDDKDNYETLFKSLQIAGTYDRNKAGIYDVTITVKDSDGNESNSYPMKIIVEE